LMGAWFRWEHEDLVLQLQVQPRASRDGFAGIHGDRLKVRIAAPPVDGKANAGLIAFLAKQFGVPKQQVHLLRGDTGKSKTVRVEAPRTLPADLPISGRK
jgi:uncharacterized protein (TIGR00251 family)